MRGLTGVERAALCIATYSPLDRDDLAWRVVDHSRGGSLLPSLPEAEVAVDRLRADDLLHQVGPDETETYGDLYPAEGGPEPLVYAAPAGTLVLTLAGEAVFQQLMDEVPRPNGEVAEDGYQAVQCLGGNRTALYARTLVGCWRAIDGRRESEGWQLVREPAPVGPWPLRHHCVFPAGFRAELTWPDHE